MCADEREGDEDEKPSRINLENQRRFSELSSDVDELDDNRVPQSSDVSGTDFVFFPWLRNHNMYW